MTQVVYHLRGAVSRKSVFGNQLPMRKSAIVPALRRAGAKEDGDLHSTRLRDGKG